MSSDHSGITSSKLIFARYMLLTANASFLSEAGSENKHSLPMQRRTEEWGEL